MSNISFKIKILLPIALIIAVLFDRLIFTWFIENSAYGASGYGVFWWCWLCALYSVYWRKLRPDKFLWFVAACSAALCVYYLVFSSGNDSFKSLTLLVLPAVLMAHAQLASGNCSLNKIESVIAAWFSGWFVKPFSGLNVFANTIFSLTERNNRPMVKKIVVGAAVTLLMFSVLIPLLSGADMVFGYYLGRITAGWNLPSFVLHLFVIIIAFALFFSFMWNIGFGGNDAVSMPDAWQIDKIICAIILGSVTLLYILFCAVQFTYLFAGEGLPGHLTYSEYAREGFAQTVAVCAINAIIFGVFLRFGIKGKLLAVFLGLLLILTGIMLFSGFTRLNLYIGAYGLTWLRVLSMWFIIYLAAVLLLCAVRMFKEKLPLAVICAALLLGWYVALGYANPDRMIERYNVTNSYETRN